MIFLDFPVTPLTSKSERKKEAFDCVANDVRFNLLISGGITEITPSVIISLARIGELELAKILSIFDISSVFLTFVLFTSKTANPSFFVSAETRISDAAAISSGLLIRK